MTAATFNAGDLVRVKSTGALATIESINPAPDYATREELWAEASSSSGYNDVDLWSPDDVELVMDAAAAAARTVPAEPDVAIFVANALHTALGDGGFTVVESQTNGDQVEVVAETGDGLTVEFVVTVGPIRLAHL